MAKKPTAPIQQFAVSTTVTRAFNEIDGELISLDGSGISVRYKKPRARVQTVLFIPIEKIIFFTGEVGEETHVQYVVDALEDTVAEGELSLCDETGFHLVTNDEGIVVRVNPDFTGTVEGEAVEEEEEEESKPKRGAKAEAAPKRGRRAAEPEPEDEEGEEGEEEGEEEEAEPAPRRGGKPTPKGWGKPRK